MIQDDLALLFLGCKLVIILKVRLWFSIFVVGNHFEN